MAGEVKTRGPSVGATCYFRIMGSGNAVWSTSGGTGGFEAFAAGDWTDYAISLTEQAGTNTYVGNAPAALPLGFYDIEARQQIGGSPAVGDPFVATGFLDWTGSGAVAGALAVNSGQLSALLPVRLTKGQMVQNFPVYFKSAADHVTPLTSGVVSGQIWKDGATTPVALQSGAFTEVGNGFYSLQALTSGDLNCTTAALLFTAVGVSGGAADPLPMSFVLQRPGT